MAVKIRLKRLGKMRAPYYRIVVMDARAKRDGRAIEEIGKYHPTEEPSFIEVNSDRAQYWLGVGAQPSEQVSAILKITGDWQKFKNLPGQEGTLKTKVAKPAFVAPEKSSVIVREAITPKAKKDEAAEAPAEAAAKTTEAE
ncbi:MAG TPA: 30S ribosomal protein S16 [Micrococcaceae bacterium]